MPRITKGGKWIYGWVVVGVDFMIQIPPVAHREYGFQPGEAVSFTRCSLETVTWQFAAAAMLLGLFSVVQFMRKR